MGQASPSSGDSCDGAACCCAFITDRFVAGDAGSHVHFFRLNRSRALRRAEVVEGVAPLACRVEVQIGHLDESGRCRRVTRKRPRRAPPVWHRLRAHRR
jgi:hypothetical protein